MFIVFAKLSRIHKQALGIRFTCPIALRCKPYVIVERCTSNHSHYDTLKVPHNATKAEIKAAYKAQVAVTHPDVNPHEKKESHGEFCALQEAFTVLSNEAARKEYDNALKQSKETTGHSNNSNVTSQQTSNFNEGWNLFERLVKRWKNQPKDEQEKTKTENSYNFHKSYNDTRENIKEDVEYTTNPQHRDTKRYKAKTLSQQALVRPLMCMFFMLYAMQMVIVRVFLSDNEELKDRFFDVHDIKKS